MKTIPVLLFSLLLWPMVAKAQERFPQHEFQAPVNIPLYLSGNFGEIRSNHFHTGLDIKTQGREGIPVVAAAGGYVSRIKISVGGYGKALYVTHPNGYTTVYGHLKSFSPEIAAYVRKAQYEKQKFGVELFPMATALPVQAGDEIALSGNTGGSGGPHLHFEIRETTTEVPVNPLLFGFDIKDNIPPTIQGISIYPLNDKSQINGGSNPVHLKATGNGKTYSVGGNSTIRVHGEVGFGIRVIDKLNGVSNRNGAYVVKLTANGETLYQHRMDRLPFDKKRYINSHIDYHESKKNRRRIQRSYLLPHNNLNIYESVRNRGRMTVPEDSAIAMDYEVLDAYGNRSVISFNVKGAPYSVSLTRDEDKGTLFRFDQQNKIDKGEARLVIPPFCLYDNTWIKYKRSAAIPGAITPTHHMGTTYQPCHEYMRLSIQIPELTGTAREKALIVALNEGKKVMAAEGGTIEGRFITVKTRSFGPYTVMIDSIPPKLASVNITPERTFSKGNGLHFKATDNLSGIKEWNAYLNGKWVLTEYDRKTKRMTYFLDPEEVQQGRNELKLTVTDKMNNTRSIKATFMY